MSRYSGWNVKSVPLDNGSYYHDFEDRTDVYLKDLGARKAERSLPPPPSGGEDVVVNRNEKHDGIEIKFPSEPSEDIRRILLAGAEKFRYHRAKRLWYGKMTPGREHAATAAAALWRAERTAEPLAKAS